MRNEATRPGYPFSRLPGRRQAARARRKTAASGGVPDTVTSSFAIRWCRGWWQSILEVGRWIGGPQRFGCSSGGVDSQLGQVGVVDGGDALLRPADRQVAVGAAVDLAARGIAVPRPDELLADDRTPAGGA